MLGMQFLNDAPLWCGKELVSCLGGYSEKFQMGRATRKNTLWGQWVSVLDHINNIEYEAGSYSTGVTAKPN